MTREPREVMPGGPFLLLKAGDLGLRALWPCPFTSTPECVSILQPLQCPCHPQAPNGHGPSLLGSCFRAASRSRRAQMPGACRRAGVPSALPKAAGPAQAAPCQSPATRKPEGRHRLCGPRSFAYSAPTYSVDVYLVGTNHCAEREEGHRVASARSRSEDPSRQYTGTTPR